MGTPIPKVQHKAASFALAILYFMLVRQVTDCLGWRTLWENVTLVKHNVDSFLSIHYQS